MTSGISRRSSNESQKSPKSQSIEMVNFAEYWDFHNKFRGCMVGSLLGDCIGTLFERDYSVSLPNLKDLYTTLTKPSSLLIPPHISNNSLALQDSKSDLANPPNSDNPTPLPTPTTANSQENKTKNRDSIRSASIPEDDILQPIEMSLAERCKRLYYLYVFEGTIKKTGLWSQFYVLKKGTKSGFSLRKPLAKKFSMTDSKNRPLERFSDDTVMLKSVLTSLIRCRGLDPKDMAMQLSEDYFRNLNRKFGLYLRDIFLQLRENGYQDPYSAAKAVRMKNGALGNGSATRVSPISLFLFSSPPISLIEATRKIAKITHNEKSAINGAILMALAVNLSLKWDHMMKIKDLSEEDSKCQGQGTATNREGGSSSSSTSTSNSSKHFNGKLFISYLIKKMNDVESGKYSLYGSLKNLFYTSFQQRDSLTGASGISSYSEKLLIIQEFLDRNEFPSRSEVIEKLGNSVQAINSVPASLYCFLATAISYGNIDNKILPEFPIEIENPVLRCIFYSISLGGNCDSISAMSGAIAGSYYGFNHIPTEIIESCENYESIIKLADELYKLCFSTDKKISVK